MVMLPHLAEFWFFPMLPLEVQFKIWELSLDENRIVMVRFCHQPHVLKHDFVSVTPAILHVNQSARKKGLRYYNLSLLTQRSSTMHISISIETFFCSARYGIEMGLPITIPFYKTSRSDTRSAVCLSRMSSLQIFHEIQVLFSSLISKNC